MYAEDNGDRFPSRPEDVVPYFEGAGTFSEVFRNPYQEKNVVIVEGASDGIAVRYGGYVFLNLGLSQEEIESPATLIHAYTAVVSDEQTTRSMLFADGHTERWEEERLRATLPPDVDIDALDGP